MKAGLNKVVLEKITLEESKSKISIPDHLKEVKYKVLNVGERRTTLDQTPEFIKDAKTVQIVPNSGYNVKENGKEYVVCNIEDVLFACS